MTDFSVSHRPGSIKPAIVTGTSGLLVAANPQRQTLRWMNIGAADITVVPGTTVPPVGTGMIYASSGAGKQGGSECFEAPGVPTGEFSFSAPSSAVIAVWET